MAVHDCSLVGIEAWSKLDDPEQGDEEMAAGSIGGTQINGRDQAGRVAGPAANQRLKLTEAERERWKQEERRKAEEKRMQELLQCVSAWRQAAEIRAYVQAVRTAAGTARHDIDEAQLKGWASWALTQADRMDPLLAIDPLGESQ